jgi:hypothetical protein
VTLPRLVRLLAIVVVAFALWQMRPPAEPPRVAILALPGASRELVIGAAREGDGEIRLPADISGASFWRSLVAIADADSADIASRPPLWAEPGAAVRVWGAPARLFIDRLHEDDAAFFLGSSSGAIVEAADITTGRIPFPYDRAVDAVASAVASLGRDQWSEWIPVPPAPGADADKAATEAEFQLARHTDTSYYFSPAYIAIEGRVVADAFLRGLDRELRPTIASHVTGLTRRRTAQLRGLFRPNGDQTPAIVFEDVADDATRVFAPDSTPSAVVEDVRAALAATLEAVRESVGEDGIVMVVGGPPTSRQAGTPAWYRIMRGGGRDVVSLPPVDLASAASVVRYFSGIALDASERARIPLELVQRYPVRASVSRTAAALEDEPPDQQWTASALESVPGAVSGN